MPANPIKHLIVLMMENRSFDHLLGSLSLNHGRTDIEGLASSIPPLRDTGNHAVPFWKMAQDQTLDFKPPHGWDDAHADWNQGANDGFIRQFESQKAGPNPAVVVGYYDNDTLPVLHQLAEQFTVCDHWFASLLSSTWPNRKYFHSGRRDGDSDTQTIPLLGFQTRPIYDELEDLKDPAGDRVTWKCYFTDLPFLCFWYAFAARHTGNFSHVVDFVNDCREDKLPSVSIIDPPFSLADDHPSHDPRLGQKFMGLIVDALTTSESWRSSALLLLYDEFGGFYDHVDPAQFSSNKADPDFPLGFRVPALVISPYAKRRFVSKKTYDHTSFIASIVAQWKSDIGNDFGDRWRSAVPIWEDCFDFKQDPLPLGIFTGENPPFRDLNWDSNIYAHMQTFPDQMEALLERIFLLPELKRLDQRATLFDKLLQLERSTIIQKRQIKLAASGASG